MGSFIYVQYQGEDAGAIVAHMLVTDDEPAKPENMNEAASKLERLVGFQPNELDMPEEGEDGD